MTARVFNDGKFTPQHREESNILRDDPNTEAGGYWLTKLENDRNLWPVVICDKSLIETLQVSDERPESACMLKDSNKRWHKQLRAGGTAVTRSSFPAMFLHSLELYVFYYVDRSQRVY